MNDLKAQYIWGNFSPELFALPTFQPAHQMFQHQFKILFQEGKILKILSLPST